MNVQLGALAGPVLLCCVFLNVFGEVLLSPFYPQFFSKVFGIQDLTYTGFYILICRLTVILISPIWGILSRKFAVRHLLLAGQAGTAVSTALLVTANSAAQFLWLTVVLLLFKSSYMFLYPLLVEVAGKGRMAKSAGSYHVAYHSAIILSSLAGVALFSMERPLLLFLWIAATDVVQLVLCRMVWSGLSEKRTTVNEPDKEALTMERKGTRGLGSTLIPLGIILLTFHLAIHMIRPYFTLYIERQWELSLMAGTALYLIPNAMAILCYSAVKRLDYGWSLTRALAVALPMLVMSLVLQGSNGGILLMLASRCLFGISLVIAQASLELLLFKSSQGRMHMDYSMAMAFQNGGQLLAPLSASLLFVPYGGASIFYGSAAVGSLCFALWLIFYIGRPYGVRLISSK